MGTAQHALRGMVTHRSVIKSSIGTKHDERKIAMTSGINIPACVQQGAKRATLIREVQYFWQTANVTNKSKKWQPQNTLNVSVRTWHCQGDTNQ